MTTRKRHREVTSHMQEERSYEALQSMLTGQYTEESTGARTIRQTGGKDRHSKVFTSRGPRDRRVRLSVATAIRFYDLQDRLGFEQPSKAVEWLLLHCQHAIHALPQLAAFRPRPPFAALPLSTHTSPDQAVPRMRDDGELQISEEPTIVNNPGQSSYHTAHTIQLHNQGTDTQVIHDQFCNMPSVNPQLYDAEAVSIEEDLPQSSGNPASSGASSEPAIPLSEVSPRCRPGETASSTSAGMSTILLSSTSGTCLDSYDATAAPLLFTNGRRQTHFTSDSCYSSLNHNSGAYDYPHTAVRHEHDSNAHVVQGSVIMDGRGNARITDSDDVRGVNEARLNQYSFLNRMMSNKINLSMHMNQSLHASPNISTMKQSIVSSLPHPSEVHPHSYIMPIPKHMSLRSAMYDEAGVYAQVRKGADTGMTINMDEQLQIYGNMSAINARNGPNMRANEEFQLYGDVSATNASNGSSNMQYNPSEYSCY